MNTSSVYSSMLRGFKLKSPVVFTFHLNWKTYENLGLQQFNYIKNQFKMRGIENFEFLPILTDKKTDLENRMKQFKNGIEKIADKYNQKAHVIGYSFAGIIPRGYISLFNGDDYIQSLLTLSTPHQGCRFVDFLIQKDYSHTWFLVEPALRATGVHRDWLAEEYSSKTLYEFSQACINSANVKYSSVGGRRLVIKMSEVLRFTGEDISDSLYSENPNDGLVCCKEAEFGEHLLNFDADHYEIIGMRPNFNAHQLFDFYSQNVKSNDESFNKHIKSPRNIEANNVPLLDQNRDFSFNERI